MSSFATRKRRSPRGKGRRGDAWPGNAALVNHVLTVLKGDPLGRDSDVVEHFNVAPHDRGKVTRCIERLLNDERVRWSADEVAKQEFLVVVA